MKRTEVHHTSVGPPPWGEELWQTRKVLFAIDLNKAALFLPLFVNGMAGCFSNLLLLLVFFLVFPWNFVPPKNLALRATAPLAAMLHHWCPLWNYVYIYLHISNVWQDWHYICMEFRIWWLLLFKKCALWQVR